MAKEKQQKEPGLIKQMVQVYKTTKAHDKNLTLMMLLAFLAPILVATLLAVLLPGGIVAYILWPLTGALVGVLLATIVLGRRAEKAAYEQIEGRPGAAGTVVSGGLRRSYRGSEKPVAIEARSQTYVYRAVGRGGIVLVAEGASAKAKDLMVKEERRIRRSAALSNIPVTKIHVGREPDQIPLPELPKTIYKIKRSLNRAEVQEVYNRLQTLKQEPLGIPKGIDPMRMRRPSRPR